MTTPRLLLLVLLAGCAARARGTPLPTRFVDDRFFVEPVAASGEKLTLYTDTGGGLFLLDSSAKRAGFTYEEKQVDGHPTPVVVPQWRPDAAIPLPVAGRIVVLSDEEISWGETPFDGMLGSPWFADRVWIFDYEGRVLRVGQPGDVPEADPPHRVALAFQTEGGKPTTNFPRIQARIDGETLDLLFDTGATIFMTDAAHAALADGRGPNRATSFIVATIFDRWRKDHPDWRVIEDADRLAKEPMIEVPKIEVGGYAVGPVWFTRRADRNFHQYMTQWMDKQIEGALGGSAFRYFRITVDYPNAVAVFEKI